MHRYTVAERLERLPLTRYQILLFIVIATAWFFDCVDVGMMTFVLSSLKAEFNLDPAQAGALASASFVGMFFGAAAAGLLADRFGRCVVFRWSMIIWGLASFACALAPNANTLIAFRVLLGIGMSMELPVGQALICEYVPATQRGRFIAILEGFWPLGFISAGLLASTVLPIFGWRGTFVAEALPALFVIFVRRIVPESPRWLEDSGRIEEADRITSMIEEKVAQAAKLEKLPEPVRFSSRKKNESDENESDENENHKEGSNKRKSTGKFPLADLWSAQYRKRTFMVWVLWFFALLGYYALTTWLGTLLEARGYTMAKSNEYVILISLAGIPGFMFSAFLLESWGRKPTTVLMLAASALFAFLYGNAPNLTCLIAFGLCMQFFLFGMWSALYAYTPELYPTRARATGAGFASSLGRIGALLGPTLVGVILPLSGQTGIFVMAASCLLAAALVVFVFGDETRGKILEHCAS